MPALAPNPQILRESNSRLGRWLDSLAADTVRQYPLPTASPQQMAGLLSELMRTGEFLRGLPLDRDAGLEQELGAYRKNVERLRAMLPTIHSALLEERARLERERSQLESAAQWARRARETM